MVKRLIALILCVALTSLVFASCSNGSEKAEEKEATLKFNVFDSAYSSYDSSIVSAYENLSKAVFNGETSLRFNTGMYDSVIQLFYTSYPLNVLVDSIDINDDRSGVTIKYKQDADDVKQKCIDFAAKVNEILTACKSGKVNKKVFAINAYNYISKSVKQSDREQITAYDTIMTGEGDSFTVSGALEYILRQGGVDCAHILAEDAVGSGWGLTMCTLDGESYLLDPMTEFLANKGELLCYFGMTNDDAKAEGLKNFIYSNREKAPVCDNPYFDACRMCSAWEISDDNKNLLVTRKDGNVVEIAL